MADDTSIRDLFRAIWDEQVLQDQVEYIANMRYEGTYGNITRSTTPMWRSAPVPPPYDSNWVRNVFTYGGSQWINFKQEYDKVEPEIPDYMRVSEGL